MAVQTLDLIDRLALRSGRALVDAFSRPITYLRVSVTDRCNLRCLYCMPEAGLPWIPKGDVLSYEEIVAIVRAGASAGVRSVRLTGGEPLIRRDLPSLVAQLRAVDGIDDVSLSTNALLLAPLAQALAAAGLTRVNALARHAAQRIASCAIARRPGLDRVLAGIAAALAAGLRPLKHQLASSCAAATTMKSKAFAELTRAREVYVRFIELMPVAENVGLQRDAYVSATEILARVENTSGLQPVAGPKGNGPARYFAFSGSKPAPSA